MSDNNARRLQHGIWAYAFGYFAAYAPYSALTKAMTDQKLPGLRHAVHGLELLPITTMASLVGMVAFFTFTGWLRYAGHRTIFGVSVPCPSRWTFLSGVATAGVIATTTLAYTFHGTSIVFMMLLMRGGVLVLAPIVDVISRRHVRWFSWCALLLSLASLFVAVSFRSNHALTIASALDVTVYISAYFVRLRFMSRLAKSKDRETSIRFFAEEQMVASPTIVLTLAVVALVGAGAGEVGEATRRGFTEIWSSGAVLPAIAIGLLSQGTGVFGGLVLLDGRENTFCVPVNRASSVLAGMVASLALSIFAGAPGLPASELVGAALVTSAILLLSVPPWLEARRLKATA